MLGGQVLKLFRKRKPKSTVDKLIDFIKSTIDTILDFLKNKKARFDIVRDKAKKGIGKFVDSSPLAQSALDKVDSAKQKIEGYKQALKFNEGIAGKVARRFNIGTDESLANKEEEMEPETNLEKMVAKYSKKAGNAKAILNEAPDKISAVIAEKAYQAGKQAGIATKKVKDKVSDISDKTGVTGALKKGKEKKDALQEWISGKAEDVGKKLEELGYQVRLKRDNMKRSKKRLKKIARQQYGKGKGGEDTGEGGSDQDEEKNPSWFKKLVTRQNKRKKEVEDEEAKGKEFGKKNKDGKGWMGKIIGAITGLGGFLVKGLGSLMFSAVGLLGRGLLGVLGRFVPGASKLLASGTGSFLGTAAKMAVRLAPAAISGLGSAAAAVGQTLLGVGAAIVSSPVTLAVAGTVAVGAGAYFTYKYFTRNKISDDIYGRATYLRLLMYGFDLNKQSNFHNVFKTEKIVQDFIVMSGDRVNIKRFDEKTKKDIADIYGVDGTDKAKVDILENWFVNRFIPVYRSTTESLNAARKGILLDDLDKLSQQQMYDFIKNITPPTDIYQVKELPIADDNKVTVTSKDIEDYRAKLLKEAEKIDPSPTKPKEPQKTNPKDNLPSNPKNNPTPQAIDKTKEQKSVNNTPDVNGDKSTTDKANEQSQTTSNEPIKARNGVSMTTRTIDAATAQSMSSAPKPKSKEEIKKLITDVSQQQGIDPNITLTMAAIESNFNPGAKAPTSTAKGLYQFTDPTWKDVTNKHGKEYGITPLTDAYDPFSNALMGTFFLKDNLKKVANVKQDLSPTDAYLAHFMGAGGATKFLKELQKDPNQIAATLFPDAANANKTIFYETTGKGANRTIGRARTLAEVYNSLSSLVSKRAQENGLNIPQQTVATGYTKSVSGSVPSQTNMSARTNTTTPIVNAKYTPTQPSITSSAVSTPTDNTNTSTSITTTNSSNTSNSQAKQSTATTTSAAVLASQVATPNKQTTIQPQPVQTPERAVTSSPVLSMQNTESLLSNQLQVLQQILKVLGTIDGKFDPKALGQLFQQQQSQQPPVAKQVNDSPYKAGEQTPNSLDLRRRKVTT